MNKLIALTGYAQVGKDTIAGILREFNYYRVAFADQLKEDLRGFVLTHYGLDVFTVQGEQKEMIRPMLVAHGRIKRAMNPDHWVDLVQSKISLLRQIAVSERFAISDLRYPNEAKRVKELGGEVWLVVREGYHPANDEERETVHEIIENKLYDRMIENPASILELRELVKGALNETD